MMKKTILTIAGFDPSGGAGILRDIHTIESLGGRALGVVTAITAQNPNYFIGFQPVNPDILEGQIKAVAQECQIEAIKVGMIGTKQNIKIVADFLASLKGSIPIVIDPVYKSSSGGMLTDDEDLKFLKESLIPLSTVLTPNTIEASILASHIISSIDDMKKVGSILIDNGANAVVIKGGHLPGKTTTDILISKTKRITLIRRPRMRGEIHGSGCMHSSCLAYFLALGVDLKTAVEIAGALVSSHIKETSQA